MATKKEKREAARAERLAREEAARLEARRTRRLRQVAATVAVAVVVAVVVVIAAGGSGGSPPRPAAQGSGASAGLQATAAPWSPEYSQLATRLAALNLPQQSDSVYHVHAMLRVYVNGSQVEVPANVGIDPQGQFLAPLHTHDTTGIIHMEATQTYPFTLGQFFAIWGVKFTPTQLGGYVNGSAGTVATYVNGKPVANGPAYLIKPHDAIVVAFGRPGSYPTSFKANFPQGL